MLSLDRAGSLRPAPVCPPDEGAAFHAVALPCLFDMLRWWPLQIGLFVLLPIVAYLAAIIA
jgi:hypothetical protein